MVTWRIVSSEPGERDHEHNRTFHSQSRRSQMAVGSQHQSTPRFLFTMELEKQKPKSKQILFPLTPLHVKMKTFALLTLLSIVTVRRCAPETDTYARSAEVKARIQAHIADRPKDARKLIIRGSNAFPLNRYSNYTLLDVEVPTPPNSPSQFFFCGGVLVNPSVVLTIADFVDNFKSLALAANYTCRDPDGTE